MAKGLSVEECVDRAEKIISKEGICLLLFDVRNSRGFLNRERLSRNLKDMMKNLNYRFYDHFPENNLGSVSRREKGFQILLGDGSWTAINSSVIIPKIVDYQSREYPDIPLYWGVAKDGYDESGVSLVR